LKRLVVAPNVGIIMAKDIGLMDRLSYGLMVESLGGYTGNYIGTLALLQRV
jgi:hypothetical protein